MARHTGSFEREFEYYQYRGDLVSVLFNIEFSYYAGTRHSHPGGHWNRSIGSWDPPDDAEWEIGEVTRMGKDGKWLVVTPTDWFWDAWVMPMWQTVERADLEESLTE